MLPLLLRDRAASPRAAATRPAALDEIGAATTPIAPPRPRPLRSAFQEGVKLIARHDPSGAPWLAYDNCVVLPDVDRFRDDAWEELARNPGWHGRDGLAAKVGLADALLATPYAGLCLDTFSWAAVRHSPPPGGYTHWATRSPTGPNG